MFDYLLTLRRTATHGPASTRDAVEADYALLANALQRLLAKWPPEVARRHFPVATLACSALTRRFRLAPLRLPPQVLSDLCHEIAEYVDAPVREAAVRCLRSRATERD